MKLIKKIYSFGDWSITFENGNFIKGNVFGMFISSVVVVILVKIIAMLISF